MRLCTDFILDAYNEREYLFKQSCHAFFEIVDAKVVKWDWSGRGCRRAPMPVNKESELFQNWQKQTE